LFILAAPVIGVCAAAVRVTSRGPMFYAQKRLGRMGRPIVLYKIRTLAQDAERGSFPRWSDPRVTLVGRFLRRTHLDELPQLWNVLKGELSLVGPMPEHPAFVPMLEEAFPGYRDRLVLRPGITGLAQLQLPPDINLASARRRLSLELYYVAHYTLWLDCRILLATVLKALMIPPSAVRTLLRLPRSSEGGWGREAG